jgi:hypothetical protein
MGHWHHYIPIFLLRSGVKPPNDGLVLHMSGVTQATTRGVDTKARVALHRF